MLKLLNLTLVLSNRMCESEPLGSLLVVGVLRHESTVVPERKFETGVNITTTGMGVVRA